MKRRVLITGGFGYVGGRTAQHLGKYDKLQINLGTRTPAPPPPWLPAAKTVQTDWSSETSLTQACAEMDTVLHLAAMNENDCAADPSGALLANGVATARLLKAAIDAGVRRFIYLSTAHVYGTALAGHVNELTLPRPQHPYATSHRAGEDCVLAAHDAQRIAGCVLRLSNGFGAPAHAAVNRWTLIVNDLCRQAVTQRKLVLRSTGMQVRDFMTLQDAGRALDHCMELSIADLADGLFNVGGECPMRILDLVHEIAGRCEIVLGFTPEIIHPSAAKGEQAQAHVYDIGKIKSTGFFLEGDFHREIDNTLRLCQETFGVKL